MKIYFSLEISKKKHKKHFEKLLVAEVGEFMNIFYWLNADIISDSSQFQLLLNQKWMSVDTKRLFG